MQLQCLLLVSVCVAACAPRAKIETEVLGPPTDFASLRSFAIVATEDASGMVQRDIEQAISTRLVEKGLTPMGIDAADMIVVFRASAVEVLKRELDGDPDANFYRIAEYTEGTLVIDVFDRAQARRIWHGQAVLDDRDRARMWQRKVEAVDEILAELPVGG